MLRECEVMIDLYVGNLSITLDDNGLRKAELYAPVVNAKIIKNRFGNEKDAQWIFNKY